jgi:hypothetical protein
MHARLHVELVHLSVRIPHHNIVATCTNGYTDGWRPKTVDMKLVFPFCFVGERPRVHHVLAHVACRNVVPVSLARRA